MNFKKTSNLILIFFVVSFATLFTLFAILSATFTFFKLPINWIPNITLACACVSIFISNCFVLQFFHKNELVVSFVFGLVFSAIILISTLLKNSSFLNLNFIIKTGSIIVASVLSGICSKSFK